MHFVFSFSYFYKEYLNSPNPIRIPFCFLLFVVHFFKELFAWNRFILIPLALILSHVIVFVYEPNSKLCPI